MIDAVSETTSSTSETKNKPFYTSIVHAEKYWIDQSRKNIGDYIIYITDGEKPPAKHHILWLYEMLAGGSRVNLIAPRGSAKTEICLRLMEWWIGKYPWLTNYIGSVTFQQATLRLQEVGSTIEFNPRYANIFPWIHVDKRRENSQKAFTVWSEKWPGKEEPISYAIWRTLISKYGESKDATLFCSGMTAKGVVGRRISGRALIDDAHDETNSATDEQCDKVESFVKKTLIPCMVKQAELDVIGTRWRANDLPGRLMEDKRSDGKKVWKTIELTAVNDKNESYWPELYPLDRLKEIEEEVGTVIYRLMYMNDPNAATSEQFTIGMFRRPLPEILPEFKEIVISVDLAYSTLKKADYTVFTAIAIDEEAKYNVYILDIVRGKWNRSSKKISKLISFADTVREIYGRVDYILFQNVGREPEFAGDLQETQEEDVLEKMGDIQYKVKTVQTTGDKGQRLERSIAIKIQQGRAYFNIEMKNYNAMVSEFLSFPVGHDDIVDSCTLPFAQSSWRFKGNKAGIVHIKPGVRI